MDRVGQRFNAYRLFYGDGVLEFLPRPEPTLAQKIKARSRLNRATRFRILRRDGYACRYCGAKAPDVELHVDHVLAKSCGGSNDDDNLATACSDCNLGKAAGDA